MTFYKITSNSRHKCQFIVLSRITLWYTEFDFSTFYASVTKGGSRGIMFGGYPSVHLTNRAATAK